MDGFACVGWQEWRLTLAKRPADDKFIQLLRVCYECLKNTKFMVLMTMRWNITSLMVAIQVRRALQC